MNPQHRDWLLELTSLPTAAGREDRVVEWVRRWAAERRGVELRADKFGNLVLRRKGRRSRAPIYFTAHMDHPAFVVTEPSEGRSVRGEFRGGVHDAYFVGTAVQVFPHGATEPVRGVVRAIHQPSHGKEDKPVDIELDAPAAVKPGDVMRWDTGPSRVEGDRIFVPACDDLAGVAAALAAFDELSHDVSKTELDVRVLLTRAEEVGFVGAIAACKDRTIPRKARLIALENSKSFPESPIGGGPIVRVGDRTSTFDPDLTYRVSKIAEQLAARDATFIWQRKLMPGGTCEASAYQAYGFVSTCVCLPLGNYHNMNETTGKIDAETISLGDFHGLVRLLVEIGRRLDDPVQSPPLRARLDDLFERRRGLVEAPKVH